MTRTLDTLPDSLRSYCVEPDYAKYTARDHAAWRYIMRRALRFFRKNAVAGYEEGLAKTGLSIERIPDIDDVDRALQTFGWGAVPVCGFIPPWAFLEFQARGILPIASDMRSVEHIAYTPAPDIVHEAAGHAPILPDEDYSAYIRRYARMGTKAIYSHQDLELYEAIRYLSDIKERPESTEAEINQAEERLSSAVARCTYVSEATKISRMNWWTAEYGLAGSLQNPKIYGAGLLSSVGESQNCLSPAVKKIPLSLSCTETSYDITRPQPQLFVAEDMQHLQQVLDDLDATLAYRRGGVYGLDLAIEGQAVATVELDSGLAMSGRLTSHLSKGETVEFIKFTGPVQLSHDGAELEGHGVDHHAQGFSSPIGRWRLAPDRDPALLTDQDLTALGLVLGQRSRLEFSSGFVVEGVLRRSHRVEGRLLYLSWHEASVTRGSEVFFEPSWGVFDMAVGTHVRSVFGGPADRDAYGLREGGKASTSPGRTAPYTSAEQELFKVYADLRKLREQAAVADAETLASIGATLLKNHPDEWLAMLETYELGVTRLGLDREATPWLAKLYEELTTASRFDGEKRDLINHGLATIAS